MIPLLRGASKHGARGAARLQCAREGIPETPYGVTTSPLTEALLKVSLRPCREASILVRSLSGPRAAVGGTAVRPAAGEV